MDSRRRWSPARLVLACAALLSVSAVHVRSTDAIPDDEDYNERHYRCQDRAYVSMFLVNESYYLWHDSCRRPTDYPDYGQEEEDDDDDAVTEQPTQQQQSDVRTPHGVPDAGTDMSSDLRLGTRPGPPERRYDGEQPQPDSCRPQCSLVLHKRGCLNGAGHWHGGLCGDGTKGEPPARGCAMERFTCSEYNVATLRHALYLCGKRGDEIRHCSEQGGRCQYPAAVDSRNPDSDHRCVRSLEQRHNDSDDAVDHRSHAPLVLPLSEIGLGLTDPSSASASDDSDYYITTYAIHQGIFDFLQISLSDPYMILLKDFAPCMRGLLEHHRAALLYLPEERLLVEFGRTNASGFDTLSVCTLGSLDPLYRVRYILMTVATSLSIGGLVLTIVAAFLTREHLNIPGVNLLCLSGSLTTVYVTVVVAGLTRDMGERCLPEGVLHVYGVLASLTWMNLMAFDIWNTLSKNYPMEESLSLSNRRRVALYGLYGWGVPVLLFGAGVVADHVDAVPPAYKPHFTIQCWFFEFNTWGTVIFYHAPIGVIMLANLVLFLLTARILQVTNYSASKYGLRTYRKANYLFWLYIKLFLVMGFTWVLEISNLMITTKKILIANDFINTLQGFFIFIIFACKPHVLRAVAFYCCPRWRCCRGYRRSDTRPAVFNSTFSSSRRSYSLEPSTSCQTLNCTKGPMNTAVSSTEIMFEIRRADVKSSTK